MTLTFSSEILYKLARMRLTRIMSSAIMLIVANRNAMHTSRLSDSSIDVESSSPGRPTKVSNNAPSTMTVLIADERAIRLLHATVNHECQSA